jgi:LEA14-like dessication related protein
MNKLLLGLAAAAGVAYIFLKGKKQSLENLLFNPIGIAINKAKSNFFRLVFNFKLQVNNPGTFAVNIQSIDLDVLVNGKVISNFTKELPISIAPKESKILDIEIAIQNLTVIETILEVINNKGKITVTLQGEVLTDLGKANINYTKSI